jgi:AcrR family transcriptional regulator
MNDHLTPQPAVSRRERPAKSALTRDEIIATAVRLFRSEGLKRVTMRSVAKALDTGHASLYVYVRDTADLHAQILDAELAAVAFPDGDQPWRESLVALLIEYGRVLFSHAEIAKTVFFARLDGPNFLAIVEGILAQLERGGVTGRAAAWGVDVLLLQASASAAEHADAAGDSPAPIADPRSSNTAIDSALYPTIVALRDELFSGTPLARSEWAIERLIDGLMAARKD